VIGFLKFIDSSLSHAFLKNIKFHVIHCTNSPVGSNDVQPVHFLKNDLAAPVVTIIGAYGTQTNVNNVRLKRFLRTANKLDSSYWNIDLYFGKDSTRYPMNWTISEFYRKKMNVRLDSSSKDGQLFEMQKFMGRHGMEELRKSLCIALLADLKKVKY
jgi:hypothetical protein